MKILYITCYPEKEHEELQRNGKRMSFAAQKFNKLYVKGFCLNGYDVDVLIFWNLESKTTKETYAGQTICYKACQLQGNLLKRQAKKNEFIKKTINKFSKEEKNGTVIVDVLQPGAYEAVCYAKRKGLKVVTLVTDLYADVVFGKTNLIQKAKRKIAQHHFNMQLKKADLIILLAETMKERIPKKSKCLIFNGIVDNDIETKSKETVNNKERICMYTGDIRKMYGAQNLIEAFLAVSKENFQLHLYGFGLENYPDLQEIIRDNPQIKFMGSKPNDEIVKLQKQADFLINPRLVTGQKDYVKYSFPSKNIEYMASGTPMITTKLPCMSEEYNDYVYFFEDDSVKGMENTLRYCFSLSDEELALKGEKAKNFIVSRLNNKKVTKEILNFLKETSR